MEPQDRNEMGCLVLTRKIGQRIIIGDDVVITVHKARGGSVQLGITAPRCVPVDREEVRIGREAEVPVRSVVAAVGIQSEQLVRRINDALRSAGSSWEFQPDGEDRTDYVQYNLIRRKV